MKVAVYAIRNVEGWRMRISLDLRVDLVWWGREAKASSSRVVFLAEGVPLGWGIKLEQMELRDKGMDAWSIAHWQKVVGEVLVDELQEVPKSPSIVQYFCEDSMWMWDIRDGGCVNDPQIDRKRRDDHRGRDEEERSRAKIHMLWANTAKGAGRGRKVGDLQHHGVMQQVLSRGRTEDLRHDGSMQEVHGVREAEELQLDGVMLEVFREAEVLAEVLRGRSLLKAEVDALLAEAAPTMAGAWFTAAQLAYLQDQLAFGAGVAPAASPAASPRGCAPWLQRRRKFLRCHRCGSVALGRTACASCGSAACAYCEACLAMGRSRACALLLRGAASPAVRGTAGGSPTEAMGRWGLSAAQSAAADAALRFLAEPPAGGGAGGTSSLTRSKSSPALRVPAMPDRFLLWAVTGAGKTEMIYPLLHAVLQAGGRVLVATPRRDVVLELAPRLARAFPDVKVVTLYGGSEERWRPGMLTLATTHQLMRFYQAFDLVIIDEIDAFPYHNDPMLAYAAQNACKPEGKFVYLSATPPRQLQREAASGKLPHAKVPVRFHGHPLPVPSRLDMKSVAQCLSQQRIPDKVIRNLGQSIQRGAQCFVFVSRIRHIEPLVMLLRRYLPKIRIEGTSSVDPQRAEKVLAFRDTRIRLLITTTILERGVTVPRSDVFIFDADSGLFDEASLIQMAGRAGRSKDDPAGRVFLASSAWTRSQKRAVSQIKGMNRIAQKGGYLTNHHKKRQAP
ncbi:DEAD/DEAH box helicase [Paenibacillus sp. FA6]|uniref:DEAD/DEAH box helicase n=1 Tax=Paenibacillus sp. FA6 TaxID=3413029 RepID=UPI003F659EE8